MIVNDRQAQPENFKFLVFSLLLLVSTGVATGCGADSSGDDSSNTEERDVTIPGPLMRPGQNCLACHAEGFGEDAPPFSFAGTIFPTGDSGPLEGVEGVLIHVKDSMGVEVDLTTNEAGNFYTMASLTPPFVDVTITYNEESISMPIEAPAGSCNACHNASNPVGNAAGAIRLP